jgi:hypothetical protein
VTEAALSERTALLLEFQLERVGCALERAPFSPAAAERVLASASVATMHAVTLELLTPDRAVELWREAAERHPAVAGLRPAAARFAA